MPASQHRLLLTYTSELVDGAPLFVSSNGSPKPWVGKEPAGHPFHEAALRKLGYHKKLEGEISAPEKKKAEAPSVDSYQFKGKKKNRSDGDQQDHYALLGLSHLRFLATEEQIRKSYRDVALKHHPDKQAALLLNEETEDAREAKKEEIDRHFKSIQEAYEVLIDPSKRRLYDSIDEFDDEVPSECSPEDFFKVFGPVFLRNGRWSFTQPVPSLGDESMVIADVDAFYDFWWGFKSWREFPHADEFDLEQAESREHKRWMERQNGKLREKAKKEENGRIRTLIENAYKRDPRITRRKEEEKAEKQRKKEARVLAKQEKELEVIRQAEEERLRKVEAERKLAEEASALKKVREKEKKLLRKEKQRLRAAAAQVTARKDMCISADAVEYICTSLEMADMSKLCGKLEGSSGIEQLGDILRDALKGSEYENLNYEPTKTSSVEPTANGKLRHQEEVGNSVEGSGERVEQGKKGHTIVNGGEKKERPWTKDEVELLRKAVAKYPKGTAQRWEVVSSYIGTDRSVDEILRAIKTVLLRKPDSNAFDSFLSKRKPVVDIVSPLSTRDAADAAAAAASVPGKASPVVSSNDNVGGPGISQKGKSEAPAKVVPSPDEGSSAEKRLSASQPPASGNVPVVANGNSASVDPEAWSEVQELALVKALKTFPKETAQRWERIAAAVPGKTKTQCFKKFSQLRENFRSKK